MFEFIFGYILGIITFYFITKHYITKVSNEIEKLNK